MYLCLDIGGSLIKVAVMSETCEFIEKSSIEITKTFEEMIDAIVECYEMYTEKYELKGIAISAPGAVNCEEGVIYGASAIPYIHGPNWKEILANRLGVKVSIENDANCAALAESYYGVGKDKQDIGFVVIGTGIGGALLHKNEVLHGANLHGGEIGYTIVGERNNKPITFSYAGSVGGLIKNTRERGLDVDNGVEIFELAKSDTIAKEEVDLFFKHLARGIYNLQYTYDPDVILLAGAISKRAGFVDEVRLAIDALVDEISDAKITPKIACATFSSDSNLIGALANFLYRTK